MSTAYQNPHTTQFNAEGFLLNFDAWSPELATSIAEQEGLELTDCHWEAIRFIREYYATFEMAPSPRTMIKEIGHQLQKGGCNRATLQRLFPGGGCRHACRLAGLPEGFCYSC